MNSFLFFFYYLKFFKDQFWIKIKLISRYKFKLLDKKKTQKLTNRLYDLKKKLTTAMVVNKHVVVYARVIGGMEKYSC